MGTWVQPCACTLVLMPENRSEGIASMQIVRPALSAYPRLCMGMLIVKEKHYVRR